MKFSKLRLAAKQAFSDVRQTAWEKQRKLLTEELTSLPPRLWLRSSHASSAADEDSNVTKTNGRRSLVSRSSGVCTSSTCQVHSQLYTRHHVHTSFTYLLYWGFPSRGSFPKGNFRFLQENGTTGWQTHTTEHGSLIRFSWIIPTTV